MKANEVLNNRKAQAVQDAYDPFGEDEKVPQMTAEQLAAKVGRVLPFFTHVLAR